MRNESWAEVDLQPSGLEMLDLYAELCCSLLAPHTCCDICLCKLKQFLQLRSIEL